MRVPSEIQDELSGEPAVGSTDEPAYLLLTTDAGGAPYVCMLSRAQLAAGDDTIMAVVHSAGTAANLQRSGVACLVVVAAGAAFYCTLTVTRQESADHLNGYAFELRDCKRDEVPGAHVRGLRYTVTEEMPTVEDWATTRRLLAALNREQRGAS